MYEYGQVWTIEGPDGTTIQLNAGNGMYLEDVTGFDSPNVRTNVEDLPEADGAVAGDFYYGSRSVTLRGRIGNVTAAERNQLVMNLQRAVRGLRSDVVLRSQPSGMPEMRVTARLEQPVRVTGGFVKEYMISLVCPDPRIYSNQLHQYAGTYSTTLPGAAFPWVFPVNFGGGTVSGLTTLVTNEGNIGVPPVVRVTGPIDNPQIQNATTGENVWVDNLSLSAGQWVELNFAAKTATDQSGFNRYSNIRFPTSTWWLLEPGANDVRVFGSNAGAGAQLAVDWRDAWI